MAFSRTIADLKEGEEAVIAAIKGAGRIRKRLIEMGLVRGTKLHVVGHAPLGDPIEVRVRGCLLALRLEEASSIHVVAERSS